VRAYYFYAILVKLSTHYSLLIFKKYAESKKNIGTVDWSKTAEQKKRTDSITDTDRYSHDTLARKKITEKKTGSEKNG